MGKMSSEEDGGDFLGTPANVESAARKRGSINLSTYGRKHRRRSEKETKSSRNEVGNHLEKADNRLGFPDDIRSHDENKGEISSLGTEKGGINIYIEIKIPRDSQIAAADSPWPGSRTWDMVPEVEVDPKPLDVFAPLTPNSATAEHKRRMMPPGKVGRPEDMSQEPCLPDSSAKEIKQFTYEGKEGVKKTCRRSLNTDMEKFKRKGGKDLMFDETNGDHVDFCLHTDDKPVSKPSVLLSEDDSETTEKDHDQRRKQVEKQVEKDTKTREQKELICSSSSSDAGKDSEDAEKPDEGEREWLEKERKLLHKRVVSFISSLRPIQGEMEFSPWKGSVMDSIVGAYLAQNVNDTLSSSAFMLLAAKYRHGAIRVNSPTEASKGKKKNAVSRKAIQKGKPGQKEEMNSKTQINSRRRKIKKEDDAMQNILKECHSNYQSKKKTRKISDTLDWDLFRMAQVDDISKAIQIRGMNNHLAERIKNCLDILVDKFGSTDMEWMRDVPPDEAKKYLLSIFGLGLKSVECIRLLTLRQKAFPIDRNAGRVAVRLGWVPLETLPEGQEFHLLKKYPTANSIQKHLWPKLSELDHSILYELHCQMITFGKVFCTERNPNCSACPMRAECKYFASVLASAQLPLVEAGCKTEHVRETAHARDAHCFCPKCLRIVQVSGMDIEDLSQADNEILKENIHKFMNISPQEGKTSKDLMVLMSKMEFSSVPKLKNPTRLRTEHQIYILPDSHHCLAELEQREPDDSCPYLLAIWTPENPNRDECIPIPEDAVYGTILIPARTAMRGKFPLNGTYFQANEVFADDQSSDVPVKVPKASLGNLQQTTLYCGNSMSAICRGMKTFEVEKCFRRGFVCFRGFNREAMEPKSLPTRFHHQTNTKKPLYKEASLALSEEGECFK